MLPPCNVFWIVDLSDLDELGLEDEGGVLGDDTGNAALAVGEVGGDGQLALLANLHADEAGIPALDDHAGADGEVEGLAALVALVELGAVLEGALVVDIDGVTCCGQLVLALMIYYA